MKTKLGISIGLMGAALYFMGLFGGYIPLLLLAGYVLLFESNEWLRHTAVKAAVLTVIFSIVGVCLGFFNDANNIFAQGVMMGSDYETAELVNVFSGIGIIASYVVSIVGKIIFLVLAFKALRMGTANLGLVDEVVARHFGAYPVQYMPQQQSVPQQPGMPYGGQPMQQQMPQPGMQPPMPQQPYGVPAGMQDPAAPVVPGDQSNIPTGTPPYNN